jgi:hypothetical protein
MEHDPGSEYVRVVSYNQLTEDFSNISSSTRARILVFEYTLEIDGFTGDLKEKLDREKRRMRRSRTAIPGFKEENILGSTEQALAINKEGVIKVRGVVTKKKYKLVMQKVRLVVTQLLGWYRIIREIQGDLLEKMLVIEKVPLPFKPMGRYTEEQNVTLEKAHLSFLWEGEMEL